MTFSRFPTFHGSPFLVVLLFVLVSSSLCRRFIFPRCRHRRLLLLTPLVVVVSFCRPPPLYQGSLKNKSPSNWEHDCDPLRSRMAFKHRNLVAHQSDNEQHPKQSHHPRRPAIKSSFLPCSTTPEYLHSLKTAIHYVGKLIIMAQRYFGQPPNPCSTSSLYRSGVVY